MASRRLYTDWDREELIRAAQLARLPGVRRAEACERFGLSIGMLRRALKEHGRQAIPTPQRIVLHALTDAGTRREGELPDTATLASYLDYVNKDGSTAAGARALIDEAVAEGWLSLDGARWRLLRDFP